MVHSSTMYKFEYNDGGRAALYSELSDKAFAWDDITYANNFAGSAADCVVRAFAIASGKPYREIWDACKAMMRRGHKRDTPNYGVIATDSEFKGYALSLGFTYVSLSQWDVLNDKHQRPTLKDAPLPKNCVVLLKDHAIALVDGVMQDTFNSSPAGKCAVKGYFMPIVKVALYNVISNATGLKLNVAPLSLAAAETMQRLLKNNYNKFTILKPNE